MDYQEYMQELKQNKKSKTSKQILSLFILFLILTGCGSTANMTEAEKRMAILGVSPEKYDQDTRRTQSRRSLEDHLYLNLPEDQFKQLFIQNNSSDSPFIKEYKNNKYIIVEFAELDEKARVTFENGLLTKLERYGEGSNPWGWTDETYLLKRKPGIVNNL